MQTTGQRAADRPLGPAVSTAGQVPVSSLVEAYLPDRRRLWAAAVLAIFGICGVVLTSGRLRTLAELAILVAMAYALGLLWRRHRLIEANAMDYQAASAVRRQLEGRFAAAHEQADGDERPKEAPPECLCELGRLALIALETRVAPQLARGVDAWLNHLAERELGVSRRAGPLDHGIVIALLAPEQDDDRGGGSDPVRIVAPPAWWTAGYVSGAATELGAPLVPGSHTYAAFVNGSRQAVAETRCATPEVGRRLVEMLALPREKRPLVTVTGVGIGPGVWLASRIRFESPADEEPAATSGPPPKPGDSSMFAGTPDDSSASAQEPGDLSVFPAALLHLMVITAAQCRPTYREVSFYGSTQTQLKILSRPRARKR